MRAINDFSTDLEYSLEVRKNEEFNQFYYRQWNVKLIEFVEDLTEQKRGVDKRVYLPSGKVITIDEKVRRKDYGDIFLELVSNTKTNKRGWLYTCQCDFIVYYIEPRKKAYILNALLLKMAWQNHKEEWLKVYKPREAFNKGYSSIGICIPIDILMAAIAEEMKKTY